ncbi:hypothetical protein ACJX0J_019594, partial [Zea mays]
HPCILAQTDKLGKNIKEAYTNKSHMVIIGMCPYQWLVSNIFYLKVHKIKTVQEQWLTHQITKLQV